MECAKPLIIPVLLPHPKRGSAVQNIPSFTKKSEMAQQFLTAITRLTAKFIGFTFDFRSLVPQPCLGLAKAFRKKRIYRLAIMAPPKASHEVPKFGGSQCRSFATLWDVLGGPWTDSENQGYTTGCEIGDSKTHGLFPTIVAATNHWFSP